MGDDAGDMQIRKFLKRVGVESHEAIASALAGSRGPCTVKVVLEIGDGGEPAKIFEASMDPT